MKHIILLNLVLFMGVLNLSSCTRLEERKQGMLIREELKDLSGIPAEFGTVVGVNIDTENPSWTQVWFQDAGQKIRVVSIQFHTNRINETVLVIPRY